MRMSGLRALFSSAVFGLALSLMAAPGNATSVDDAKHFIDTLGKQAFSTLQQENLSLEQRERVFGDFLRSGFDLGLIGRFVLGKYWRQTNDEQKADYIDAFSSFIIKTYARRLGGFSGQTFTITGSVVTGQKKDVMVKTRIDRPSGPPIEAAWRVREINGQNKIIDVVVEGVSMAVTQRQEFAAVVGRDGVEGLVQVLRAQTERLSVTAG